MKYEIFTSFIISVLVLPVFAGAQIQYYGIDTIISDKGRAVVNLTITFSEVEKNFSFSVVGRVENLQATSIAGPINCSVEAAGISIVNCQLSLTSEKRSIEISFETNDLIKKLDSRFFLDSDFSLNRKIDETFVSIKLPEGNAIATSNLPDKGAIFPENSTTISDGRRIIVLWRLKNIEPIVPLRFQVLYEPVQLPPLFQLRIRYFAAFGAAVAAVLGFILVRYYLRRPEKLILSVLDEYERKVMGIIVAAGKEINQKRIVQETNLSKAKVSRVIKSLVERGLVEVQRSGRTNKIKLLKKKFSV